MASIWVLVVLIPIISAFPTEELKLPLCEHCSCNSLNEVLCQRKFNMYNEVLFDESNWSFNGTLYDYPKVTVSQSAISRLTTPFVTSDLSYLSLERNELYFLGDKVFRNLENMKVLVLSHNNLDNIHPDVFTGQPKDGYLYPLRSLRELRLDHNSITGLDKDLFKHTDNLEVLSLAFNPLKVIDSHTITAITSLNYLTSLDLSHCSLTTLPEHLLYTPTKLVNLDLSGNFFVQVPKELQNSKSLETLFFNETQIESISEENGFPDMPSLKTLHFCNNADLSNISKFSLGHLSNLENLFLTDNPKLVSLDPLALSRRNSANQTISPAIKNLDLRNNQLSFLDRDLLARWDQIVQLDLSENPWTCECENQWIIDDLMETYTKTNLENARKMRCAAPIEMQDFTFYELYIGKKDMRCLDLYGHRPEKDAAILVGVLIGILLAIPIIMLGIFGYQRNWFGICSTAPAAFSRKYYSTRVDDSF